MKVNLKNGLANGWLNEVTEKTYVFKNPDFLPCMQHLTLGIIACDSHQIFSPDEKRKRPV